jgi:hypothetical protein
VKRTHIYIHSMYIMMNTTSNAAMYLWKYTASLSVVTRHVWKSNKKTNRVMHIMQLDRFHDESPFIFIICVYMLYFDQRLRD